MAIEIEVVSQSEAAKRDLNLLTRAIENIKKATEGFSLNMKTGNLKEAADGVNKINKNAADAGVSVKSLNTQIDKTSKSANEAAKGFKNTDASVERLSKNIKSANVSATDFAKNTAASSGSLSKIETQLSGIASSVIAAGTAYASFSTFDKITKISSQLKLATSSQLEFNRALEGTRDIATSTRSGIFEITDLYSRVARSTTTFSRSQKDVLDVVEATSKAINLYGTNAGNANAAVLQLGQALSSGTLAGDELKSIMENAPGLADAIAKGLSVSIGRLKEMGAAGQLTAKMVFTALLSQTKALDLAFGKAGTTFAQAFGNIGSSLLILISSAGNAMGSLLTPGGETIPSHINKIALAIKYFAGEIEWMVIRAKSVMMIMAVEMTNLTRKPLFFQVEFAKTKLENLLPSRADIQGYFSGLVGFLPSFLQPQKRASGGYISGPGTGTSDSIPAMLSNGEYVINAKAAAANAPILDAINSGKVRHFAGGGAAAGIASAMLTSNFSDVDVFEELKKIRTTIESAFSKLLAFILNPSKVGDSVMRGVNTSMDVTKDGLSKLILLFNQYLMPLLTRAISATGKYASSMLDAMTAASPAFAKFVETTRSLTRTGPYTGGGPFRLPENRSVLHDVVNTFIPTQSQIPVLAGATAAIAAGVMAFTSAGTARSVILGLLTTAFGLVTNSVVTDKEINRFQGALTASFIDMTKKVTDTLFGSGIFGERGFGGTLILIAKMSLLFAAGREAVLGALKGAVTAPTSLGNTVAMTGQAKVSELMTLRQESKLAKLDAKAAEFKQNADESIKNLVRAGGGMFNTNRATAFAQGSGTLPQQANRIPNYVGLTRAAFEAQDALKKFKDTQGQQHEEVKKNVTAMRAHTDALKANLAASGAAFRQGAISTAGGVGGIFGALGGFNIGSEIAKGMTGASEWQKVGVIMGSAMLGQTLLSTAAAVIATGLTSSLVLGIGAIIGAIALTLKYLINPEAFNAAIDAFKPIGLLWATQFVDYLRTSFPKIFKLLGGNDLSTESLRTNKEIVDNAGKIENLENNDGKGKDAYYIALRERALLQMKSDAIALDQRSQKHKDRPDTFGALKSEDIKAAEMSVIFNRASYLKAGGSEEDVAWKEAKINTEDAIENSKKILRDTTNLATLLQTISSKLGGVNDSTDVLKSNYNAPTAPAPKSSNRDPIVAGEIERLMSSTDAETRRSNLELLDKVSSFFNKLNPFATEKRATGGRISGPGTGTSDSIPAMLSNGEFVINAKASAENADILHAINSGKSVKYFAKGRTNEGEIAEINADPLRKELREYALMKAEEMQMNAKFVDALIRSESGYIRDAKSGTGAEGVMQFIKDTAAHYGVGDKERITNPTKAIDAGITHLKELFVKYSGNLEKVAAAYNQGEPATNKVLAASGGNLDFSKFKTLEPAKFVAMIRARGGIDHNADTALPSATSLAKLSPITRNQFEIDKAELLGDGRIRGIVEMLLSVFPETAQKKAIEIGMMIRKALFPMTQAVNDVFGGGFDRIVKDVNAISDSPVSRADVTSLSNPQLAQLKEAMVKLAAIEKAREGGPVEELRDVELNNSKDEVKTIIKELFAKPKKDDKSTLVQNALSATPISKLNEELGKLGVGLNKLELSKLTSTDMSNLEEYFKNIRELTAVMPAASTAQKEHIELIIKETQAKIRSTVERVKPSIATSVEETNKRAQAAGAKFAGDVQSSFETGLRKLLKGTDGYSLKDLGADLLDKFTSGIIDAAVKNFSEDLFSNVFNEILGETGGKSSILGSTAAAGEDGKGGIGQYLKKGVDYLFPSDALKKRRAADDATMSENKSSFRLSEILDRNKNAGPDDSPAASPFDGVIKGFEGFGTKIESVMASSVTGFGQTFSSFTKDFGSGLEGFGESFSSLLGSLGSTLSGLFGGGGGGGGFSLGSIFSLFAADGGYVSGPGSARSDSIPAMLSNGEFVINAAATQQYKGLLTKINSGEMPKFANGGFVTDAMSNVGLVAQTATKTGSAKTSSTFNINVTGDISRQTRREIQQMIPQIAVGVNSHNYEQGTRR